MFAVIKTGSKQYMVKDGQTLLIEQSAEKTPKFDVLAYSDGKTFEYGTPTLEKTNVKLEVVEDVKGPKIKILKHRPKKHSRSRMGHRQKLVKVKVTFGTAKPAEKKEPTKEQK